MAVAAQLLRVLLEIGDLVLPRRDIEHADRLVARVDPQLVDRFGDAGEVLAAVLLEPLDLLREAREAVRQSVRER